MKQKMNKTPPINKQTNKQKTLPNRELIGKLERRGQPTHAASGQRSGTGTDGNVMFSEGTGVIGGHPTATLGISPYDPLL